MFSIILIILVVIIAAVLIYAATRPNDFVTSRTANIKAPAEAIFPLINDFSRWPTWSPYEKLDPEMKRTLSGAESGKGAAYAWESNGKAGKGRMEIINSAPSSLVSLKLDFEKPFRANNMVDFTLTPSGDSTTVTCDARQPALHRQADGRVHELRHADRSISSARAARALPRLHAG